MNPEMVQRAFGRMMLRAQADKDFPTVVECGVGVDDASTLLLASLINEYGEMYLADIDPDAIERVQERLRKENMEDVCDAYCVDNLTLLRTLRDPISFLYLHDGSYQEFLAGTRRMPRHGIVYLEHIRPAVLKEIEKHPQWQLADRDGAEGFLWQR